MSNFLRWCVLTVSDPEFPLLSVLSAVLRSPELSLMLFLLLLLLTFEATKLIILKTDSKRAKILNVPILSEPKKNQRKKLLYTYPEI